MKKWMKIIVAVMAVLMLAVPALGEDTARPNIIAHKAAGVVIDGNLGEWNLDSPAVVNDAAQLIKDAHMWKGTDDLSVTFYLAWDEDNIYIAADVTEDTPLGAIEMLPVNGEDNLILYLSTDPNADPDREAYGTNDFMIYFVMDEGFWSTVVDRSMLPKDVNKSVRYKSLGSLNEGGENVLPGYECAVEKTVKGFTWEAKVPWSALSKENELQDKKCSLERYTPAVGDTLLCDFSITDIDYPCPGTEYIPEMAWTGTAKIKTTPLQWGSVTLTE